MNETSTISILPATITHRENKDLVLSPRQASLLQLIRLFLILSAPFWIWALFFAGDYEFGTSLIYVPVLCLANIAIILKLTDQAPTLRKVMLISFFGKIASAGGYMALLYVYYVKGADATVYYNVGRVWAANFSAHGSFPIQGKIFGTSFINLCSAVLTTIMGPAFPTFNVLFAACAFWGSYYFYRAFRVAFPRGPKELAALLLFLFPSCQFWTAALGKDALMYLSIGMASYGLAELVGGRLVKGFLFLVPATLLGVFTRPHVIGMVGIAMLLPYAFGQDRRGALSAFAKILGVPIMVGGVAYLVRNASQLFKVDSPTGLLKIEKLGAGTMHGGSSFGAGQSSAIKLLLSPLLVFRPLPWEVPNALGAIAMIESMFLLYMIWKRRTQIAKILLHWRANAFVTFAVTFGAIFSVVFSFALSNFGLLIRQRTQVTPLVLMIIAACTTPQVPDQNRGKSRS